MASELGGDETVPSTDQEEEGSVHGSGKSPQYYQNASDVEEECEDIPDENISRNQIVEEVEEEGATEMTFFEDNAVFFEILFFLPSTYILFR